MTASELVIAALGAGAGIGVKDVATLAVKDAYASLKTAITRHFGEDESERQLLPEYAGDSAEVMTKLGEALRRSGALDDPEVLEAAARLMQELAVHQQTSHKFHITASDTQIGQIGDHNRGDFTFHQRPSD
jgi:hypothetical protein